MKIWLVTIGEPLPLDAGIRKMRTAMLADHLVERGHNVRWWASAFEHQRKLMLFKNDQEVPLSQGFTLQVLRGCGYSKNISLSRYLDHLLIAREFHSKASQLKAPDIIIASMPCHHLAYEAVRYSRRSNIPVLVDIRDLWPDIFLSKIQNPLLHKVGRLALSFDCARLRSLLKQGDGLIAVSKGYLTWGLEKAERAANEWDRVFMLGYKPMEKATNARKSTTLPQWLRGHETQKLLIFIGTFGASYELRLLVKVARRLQCVGKDDVCFVLAGMGEQSEILRREISGLSNVLLPGWLGSGEITALLAHGYLGLVPVNMAKDTLSNKPFEYLSAGLPLISSLEGEMPELINEYGFGKSYRAGDLEGLYVALETLLDDQDTRNRMAANALTFFKEHGDADKIYAQYARHIENLAEAKKISFSHERYP